MPITILVADDDDGYRYPIVNMLEDAGFNLLEASNIDEVLEQARKAEVWVIDVRLPSSKNEGILAVHKLAKEGFRSIYPVIFISATSDSLAAGPLDELKRMQINYLWIEKPFEPELLLKRINELLNQ